MISSGRVRRRVAALARQIENDHRGARLTLVVVLKGAAIFAADLARRISIPFALEFVGASSYGEATRSSGTVNLSGEAALDIAGGNVIVVEDIVDTGLTVRTLVAALERLAPASIEVCALLLKQTGNRAPPTVRYKGFDIPDCFVVGYGMDYAERYRNLDGVYRLLLEE